MSITTTRSLTRFSFTVRTSLIWKVNGCHLVVRFFCSRSLSCSFTYSLNYMGFVCLFVKIYPSFFVIFLVFRTLKECSSSRFREKTNSNNGSDVPVVVINQSTIPFSTTCRSSDFEFGQWIKGSKKCGLLTKYAFENATKLSFSDMCWKPNHCKPAKFSPESFCSLVKGKTILFVGDSILHQMYVAMYNQIASRNNSVRVGQFKHSKYPSNDTKIGNICNGESRVLFIRNDHWTVPNIHNSSNLPRVSKICHVCLNEWSNGLSEVDILVLSKGHHIIEAEVSESQFREHTAETLFYLKQYIESERTTSTTSTASTRTTSTNNPEHKRSQPQDTNIAYTAGTLRKPLSVYFLETSPGHALCSAEDAPYTEPLENQEQYDQLLAKYRSEKLSKFKLGYEYAWWDYERHDEYIKTLLEAYLPHHSTVIPITHMSFLRPDSLRPASGDCLHYLDKGVTVVDSWVYLWYNLMLSDPHIINNRLL